MLLVHDAGISVGIVNVICYTNMLTLFSVLLFMLSSFAFFVGVP